VQCKKKHLTVCAEFTDTGSCPRGSGCPLRHVAKKRRIPDTLAPAKAEHDAPGYGRILLSYADF